jgi:hypothetical protein
MEHDGNTWWRCHSGNLEHSTIKQIEKGYVKRENASPCEFGGDFYFTERVDDADWEDFVNELIEKGRLRLEDDEINAEERLANFRPYGWLKELLTGQPGSDNLRSILELLELMKQNRWKIEPTLEWVERTGFKFQGDIDHLYRGRALPVLTTIDAKRLGRKMNPRRSDQIVWSCLRMMRHEHHQLIMEVGRLEHGQKVYSLGWWHMAKGMPHPKPQWHLYHSRNWKRRLGRIAQGKFILFPS